MIDILGMKLLHTTDTFAELTDSQDTLRFMLRTAPTLAHASHGYSPILNFEIADIDSACKRAKDEYEAELDGPIAEDEFMKVACIRTSCGLTISLH